MIRLLAGSASLGLAAGVGFTVPDSYNEFVFLPIDVAIGALEALLALAFVAILLALFWTPA